MYSITVEGIEITVQKKKIKNMYIRVSSPDGTVSISAPHRLSVAVIRDFASSRVDWIEKQRSRIAELPQRSNRLYESGELCYLRGHSYTLNVVSGCFRNEVSVSDGYVTLRLRGDGSEQQRTEVMNEWYRTLLKDDVPPVLARCERIVGVTACEWRIKSMRTRWGTCNIPSKRIWLNLRLIEKPPECLEYVIIHELVHLLERGHNDRFRAYMDRFCPEWRTIKARLNSMPRSTNGNSTLQ